MKWVLAVGVLLAVGCTDGGTLDLAPDVEYCEVQSDCEGPKFSDAEYFCVDVTEKHSGRCVTRAEVIKAGCLVMRCADGGQPDAGSSDAGDASEPDAGIDAGDGGDKPDAGEPDAGDAGAQPDAGSFDPSPAVGSGYEAVGATTATVNWSASEVLVAVAVNYSTNQNTSNEFVKVGLANQQSGTIQLDGLSPITKYYFTVVGVDVGDKSGQSPALSFSTTAVGGDTTPPQIIATNGTAAQSTVTVSWGATEPLSEVKIEYGTNGQFNQSRIGSVSNPQSGTIALNSLSPSTVYNYRVVGKDLASNSGTSANGLATTASLQPGDTTSPQLEVYLGGSTENTATIGWYANEAVTGTIQYGVSAVALTQSKLISGFGGNVVLATLQPATTYFYKIVASDLAGNRTEGVAKNFTTQSGPVPDTTLPQLDVYIDGFAQNAATLRWWAYEMVVGTIQYGMSANALTETISVSGFGGNIALTSLQPGTTYYYKLTASDQAGNSNASVVKNFTTASVPAVDTTPPQLEVFAAGTTETSATIGWYSNEHVEGTIKYSTNQSGVDSGTGVSINVGFGGRVELVGLATGTTYYFKLIAKDGANNVSNSPVRSIMTVPVTPSAPPTVTAQAGAVNLVAPIYWYSNHTPTSVKVEYGTSGQFTQTEVGTTSPIMIKNPVLGTTYNFRVVVVDTSGLSGTSATGSFTVPLVISGDFIIRCKAHVPTCVLKVIHPSLLNGSIEQVGMFKMSIDVLCSSVNSLQNSGIGEVFFLDSYIITSSGGKLYSKDYPEMVLPDLVQTVLALDPASAPNSGSNTTTRVKLRCPSFGYFP